MRTTLVGSFLIALALTGCTATEREAADPSPVLSPSRAPGVDLVPSAFNRVRLCGPAVSAPNSSDGQSPCRSVMDAGQVQRLQQELLAATVTAADDGCVRRSRRVVLTVSDAATTGLRVPSLEAFLDCRLVRRLGTERYFTVSTEAEQLMRLMATVPE